MQIQTPAAETEITSASQLEDKKVEPAPEINGTVGASNGQSGSLSPKESVTSGFTFFISFDLCACSNEFRN